MAEISTQPNPTKPQQAQAGMEDVAQRERALQAKYSPQFQQISRGMESTMGGFQQSYGSQAMPAIPNVPPPEFHPSEFGSMFGLLMVASSVLGRRSKDHSMFAMKALNGMLEGKREGDANKYNQSMQQYKNSMAQLKDNADRLMEARKQAWSESKGQLDVYQHQWNELLRQEGVDLKALKDEGSSYQGVAKIQQSMDNFSLALERQNLQTQKMAMQWEQFMAKLGSGQEKTLDARIDKLEVERRKLNPNVKADLAKIAQIDAQIAALKSGGNPAAAANDPLGILK